MVSEPLQTNTADDEPLGRRSATGLTMAFFLVLCGALSFLPVPDAAKPLSLPKEKPFAALYERVMSRPKMTLAELENVDRIPPEDDENPAAEQTPPPPSPPVAVEAGAVKRESPRPPASVEQSRRQADKLGAPGARVDNPCARPTQAGGCEETALDPFFAALDAARAGEAGAKARVIVLGNSMIASDHVVDRVRARFVQIAGDGGRGFLLTDRLAQNAGRRVRTGQTTSPWKIHTIAGDVVDEKPLRFGLPGSLHESKKAGDRASFRPDGATRGTLVWWTRPGAPSMRIEARGQVLARIDAGRQNVEGSRTLEVDVPAGAPAIDVVVDGPGALVAGMVLENDAPGVVLDTFGVPASSAPVFMRADEAAFTDELALRDPALVVIMLGGNEVRGISFGKLTPEAMEQATVGLLERIQKAAPRAACLVVTPLEAVKATSGGELSTREEIDVVIAAQKRAAGAQRCAVFDLFSAMGGRGSLGRFKQAKLMSDDLVHPTGRGGDVLGNLMADALVDAWESTPRSTTVARRAGPPRYRGLSIKEAPPGSAPPPHPLARFFDKLFDLEHHRRARAAVGQFGASHTAAQMMTDRIRARLSEQFGNAGRGFIAVGRPSKRLSSTGIVRALDGSFEISDGRTVNRGGAVGMAGVKARLEPGARFEVTYCQRCPPQPALGFVELSWLYTPDMGTADVLLDGKQVAVLTRDERRSESDVQFLRVPVDTERATLAVQVREGGARRRAKNDDDGDAPTGPVHLLNVVEEMARPGIVWDAVGLPGTTGMTPQRWRQDLLAEEVRRRGYDLVVTFWGTNEASIDKLDADTYRGHFEATLHTLLEASPGADCLILGATDRFDTVDGKYVSAPSSDLVERVQKEVAAQRGCAFFSSRRAMGGPGSMKRWVKEGLGHEDHVHFTPKGYEVFADLLLDDLMAAYHEEAASRSATDVH